MKVSKEGKEGRKKEGREGRKRMKKEREMVWFMVLNVDNSEETLTLSLNK